ncbi:MAG: hypothetical protein V1701_03225 [Planctomycetota bacterium]
MPRYTSSCFLFVLENKGEDDKETINLATQRLLETKKLLLVKRDGRNFYIHPGELRDSDIVQNQNQQDQSNQIKEKEMQND